MPGDVGRIALIGFYDRPHYLEGPRALYRTRRRNDLTPTHQGVDIQTVPGQRIVAPENGIICSAVQDPRNREMAEIDLVTEDQGIVYTFSHLAFESLPPAVRESMRRERTCFEVLPWGYDMHSRTGVVFGLPNLIRVEKGEELGRVGEWKIPIRGDIPIHPEVERQFGRGYHHLHLGTSWVSPARPYATRSKKAGFNPLLLLKNLS